MMKDPNHPNEGAPEHLEGSALPGTGHWRGGAEASAYASVLFGGFLRRGRPLQEGTVLMGSPNKVARFQSDGSCRKQAAY